jgi:hypothetical protein
MFSSGLNGSTVCLTSTVTENLEQNQDNRALNDCVQGADFLRKSALYRFALEYIYPDFALSSGLMMLWSYFPCTRVPVRGRAALRSDACNKTAEQFGDNYSVWMR